MSHVTRRHFVLSAAATAGCGQFARSILAAVDPPKGSPDIIDVVHNRAVELRIARTQVEINGRASASAITVNGTLPGPTLRMREGQEAVIRVSNHLSDEDTSIHWHGLIVPYTMDGVPGVSFPGIKPGETFTYRFRVRQNGTYWYHSHSGLQEQLGHYGAIIIDPRKPDPFTFDRDYVVVLSDWMFKDPYVVLEKLKKFEGYFNYQRPTLQSLVAEASEHELSQLLRDRLRWDAMRMDPTDLADITGAAYTYLMNGHAPLENWTAPVRPGEVVRLRLVNAATMTYFDFRVPGLPMTVVAADGQKVRPIETDELRLAAAETYDVLVRVPDARAYTLLAETMDRSGFARGNLTSRGTVGSTPLPARRKRPKRTMADMGMASMGAMPQMMEAEMPPPDRNAAKHDTHRDLLPTDNLPEVIRHGPDRHGPGAAMIATMPRRRYAEPGIGLGDDGWRVLTYGDLRALECPVDRRAPDRQLDLHLTGNMGRYIWGFDGRKYSEATPIRFVYGERIRLNMINDTLMDHPIHLHGMWMDLYAGGTLKDHPRKHTVSVKPGELLTVDVSADAPGRWALHCHLLYHMEMGMFRTVAVVRSLDHEVAR